MSDWYGVTTDEDGRVTELDLPGNSLSGHLPPEIGNLEELTYLNIMSNRLTGTLPPELGDLTRLEFLYLDDNRLWGEFPRGMTALTSLRLLNTLNNNGLCMPDKPEFREWVQAIPSGFAQFITCGPPSRPPDPGDLAVLATFYSATDGGGWDDSTNWLSDRPLQYWKGVSIDSDGRVTGLSLSNNQLSGKIPVELGQLSALELLVLDYNELSGPIPGALGTLTNLKGLLLGNNQMSGEIPSELGNLVSLERLYLDGNRIKRNHSCRTWEARQPRKAAPGR